MSDIIRSPCLDATPHMLSDAIHFRGWGVEAYFSELPVISLTETVHVWGYAIGGRLYVSSSHVEKVFKHELTHILIDRLRLAPWSNAAHHLWMDLCLP